ncbi:hypothetical protein II906_09390 [bacterium]|nr:hypothetical protein [bacterium]
MKKILVLFLMLFLSVPAFAVPGYKEAMEAVGGEQNTRYDVSEQTAYWNKLEKEFFEKYPNGSFTGEQYDKEVRVPYYNFTAELQRKGYPGFDN